jgi:signal recognition particle receptor subunit beta
MSQPQLSESLLLVYCNKVDIPGAASASELARLLEVRDVEASHLVLSTTPPGILFEHSSWSPT